MALFRRRSQGAPPSGGVQSFWAWWAREGADGTAAAYEAGTLGTWAIRLGEQVSSIDDALEWELGPGVDSRHVLVVTAAGNPDLRAVARRWRRAAPAPDATWQYADARLPSLPLTWSLEFAGHDVEAAATLVGVTVDAARGSLDARVYHPTFGSMSQKEREQVSYLLLDSALGEEAVEIWIGEVASATRPPEAGITLPALREAVDQVAAANTDANGEHHWAILRGTGPNGKEVLVSTQVPLRPMTSPHLDTYVGIDLAFDDVLPSGMPGEASLVRLRALQDHLDSELDGSGKTVAHETSDGSRRLHLYVDSAAPAVDQLRALLTGWDRDHAALTHKLDPSWHAVSHILG
ncbi:hypothetical protein acdb102_42470 [Acidothermaceae bacterium B102]|nr:hypothetical protein acdb102_42470 [Acidothermaceae bacterium B102]